MTRRRAASYSLRGIRLLERGDAGASFELEASVEESQFQSAEGTQHVEAVGVAHVRQPPDVTLQRVLTVGKLVAVLLLKRLQRGGSIDSLRHRDHRPRVVGPLREHLQAHRLNTRTAGGRDSRMTRPQVLDSFSANALQAHALCLDERVPRCERRVALCERLAVSPKIKVEAANRRLLDLL